MDLMQKWRRNLQGTSQVAFVPNYTSYDFVPKGQTISLKNLVVLVYAFAPVAIIKSTLNHKELL